MKIILGIEMRRTPSKVAGFSSLMSPTRGVTSCPRVDRHRRLARGIFFCEKKKNSTIVLANLNVDGGGRSRKCFQENFREFECR